MKEYITRDFTVSAEKPDRNIRRKRVDEPIERDLQRILFIGPRERQCHIGENIYECFVEEGYDCKFLTPQDLKLNDLQKQRKMRYPLNQVYSLLNGWKPQMIFVDECSTFFFNTLSIPVFAHQREFKRGLCVDCPTVMYFWHEDIITNYEKFIDPLGMAQIPNKEVLYIAYNPKVWEPQKKTKKGLYGNGFREGFKIAYEANELAQIADWMVLEKEHEESKKYLTYIESHGDFNFREFLPSLEAFWCPVCVRQYTTRVMLECMASKVLVLLKLEDKRHEEILQKMGLYNMKHYVGIDKISELESAFKGCVNKEEIIENAYKVVSERHTYYNRMKQIIKRYNELTGV